MDNSAAQPRSWLRPHVVAVVAACLALLVLAFLNFPGNLGQAIHPRTGEVYTTNFRVHGWPFDYLRRERPLPTSHAPFQVPEIWAISSDVTEFHFWRLAANGAIVVGIALAVGALVECLVRMLRPRLRYSLRTAMIAVGGCSIVLGLIHQRWRNEERQQVIAARIDKLGGYTEDSARLPDWIPNLLGRYRTPLVDEVVLVWLDRENLSQQDLEDVLSLTSLRKLYLKSSAITDQHLARIGELRHLTHLSLSNAAITDAGLQELQSLRNLQLLELPHTPLNGSGLKYLQNLSQLGEISLNDTQVNDAALEHLVNLPKLHYLSVFNTQVTAAGAASFKARAANQAEVGMVDLFQ